MDVMKLDELKKLDKESLQGKLNDTTLMITNILNKKAMGSLDKPHELKVLKKTRARIKTLLAYK